MTTAWRRWTLAAALVLAVPACGIDAEGGPRDLDVDVVQEDVPPLRPAERSPAGE